MRQHLRNELDCARLMLESPGRPVLIVAVVGSLYGFTYSPMATKQQALKLAAMLRMAADDLEGAAK